MAHEIPSGSNTAMDANPVTVFGQPVACPKCGHANPGTAYFCISCHQILIHRCPNCWHEQRAGVLCEKCGTCFALYWEEAFERAVEEENRVWWAKLAAGAEAFLQILQVPFIGLAGILRTLLTRLFALRFSNR
jgi:hypothetical protein